MKAKWLKEIKGLLSSQDFKDWWRDYTKTQIEIDRAKERLDELLTQENLQEFRSDLSQKKGIDTLYQSSGYEDQAAKMVAEASELENRSYEAVANFEEKRVYVSDLWFKVGAHEHRIEEIKASLEERNAKLAATKDRNVILNIKSDIKALEAELKKLEKEYGKLSEEYEKEAQKKSRLWEEVETVWIRSLEYNLKVAENEIKAKKVKVESQRFFSESEESKKRSLEVKAKVDGTRKQLAELEKSLADLRAFARDRLECIAEEDFLYWQQRENNRMVFCVPLVTDMDNYNIEIKALGVYQADRQRGVKFIEPAVPEQKVPVEDRRIDEFFTVGRKGM